MTMFLLENLLSHGTIERLGWMLVHGLWQAAAVAVLLAILLRLLQKAGPNVRYGLACAALALMVALAIVTWRVLRVAEPVAEAGRVPVAATLPPMDPLPAPQTLVAATGEMPALPETSTGFLTTEPLPVGVPLRERIVSVLTSALPYVVLAWLVCVCGLSVWYLGGWTRLQRFKRRMVRAVGSPLQQSLEDLTTRLGVRRAVGLLESALVEVPTVVGWLRPAILLPASALTGLHPEQLAAIIAHELAHIRRYDYLVNMLQTVVEILGFYHPAVWWVSHRIRIERENCCDDLAVRACSNPLEYARTLACMEEIRQHGTELAVAASGGSLPARIARLLGRPAVEDRRFAWLPGLIALLLVVALLLPAALVLGTPQPSPAIGPVLVAATDGVTEPNSAASDRRSASGSPGTEAAQVLLDLKIIRVLDDLPLDEETAFMVANGLGLNSRLARALLRPDRKTDMTLGEILKRHIVAEPLSEKAVDTLVSLLGSRGYVTVLAAPRAEVYDSRLARIRIAKEHFLSGPHPSAKPEKIECDTVMEITPHVLDIQRVNLDMMVEVSDLAAGPDVNQPVVRRTSAETSVTAWNDRYLIWAAPESPAETAALNQGRESLYVMVKPVIQANGFAASPAGAPPAAPSPRQMLLDVRTVTLKQGDLLNVGIEWGWPKIQAGVFGNPAGPERDSGTGGGWPQGVQIGYTPDRTFTDALLATLDLLRKNQQATISTQQILAQDGRKAQIKTLTEEWLPAAAPTAASAATPYTIETGTVVAVTPHVGDTNIITLQIAVETSDRAPMVRGGSALPMITRRTTKNTVTLKDGGTVALAGMTTRAADPNHESGYETAIFVTVHLLPEMDAPPASTTLPASPAPQALRTDKTPDASATRTGPAQVSGAPVAVRSVDSPRTR